MTKITLQGIKNTSKHAHPNTLNPIKWLATRQFQGSLQKVRIPHILGGMLRRLTEQTFELVTSPLQSVLNSIGEVLKGTDRDALFRGVLRRAVGFCQEWDYNLWTKVL